MKLIIVEDEEMAVRRLKALLHTIDPSIQILATLESVRETIRWIRKNPVPDLGFFDIQLSDDISFEIFKECDVNFPVVFITAYDDYLLQSFEYNSIHYLLKPVTQEKISQVIDKLKRLESHFVNSGILNYLSNKDHYPIYKNRLVVKKGMDFAPLGVDQIAYFFTEHKICFVRDYQSDTYTLDESLSELESILDPTLFFRANRQYIIHISAIKKYTSLENSRIRLELDPPPKEEVIIGKENGSLFRKWVRGELN